jgi:hypothetical protein
VLAILATAVYVASRTVVAVVAVAVELLAVVELTNSLDGGTIMAVIVELLAATELTSPLASRNVGQTFLGPLGGVNVVVKVPIRAPEQVHIPSPSSRLVFSQLKEMATSDIERGGRVEALEDEVVGDVLGVLPVCRLANDVVDEEGNVWDDIEDDNADNEEDGICQGVGCGVVDVRVWDVDVGVDVVRVEAGGAVLTAMFVVQTSHV